MSSEPVALILEKETRSLREVIALFVVFALILGFVAIGTRESPPWELFTALALLSVLASRFAPTAFIVLFAIIEPLQSLLISVLPGQARQFDEVVMLGFVLTVVTPVILRSPRALWRDPFVQVLGWFVGFNLLSAAINGVEPKVALSGIFVTIDYALLFIGLRALPVPPQAVRQLMLTLFAIGCIALAVGVVQHQDLARYSLKWQMRMFEDGHPRVPAIFEHPNDFGYFMMDLVFFALAGLVAHRRKLLFAFVLAVAIAGVVLSVSRSSYMGLAAGIFVATVAGRARALKWVVPLGALLAFLIGGIAVRAVEFRMAKIKTEGGDARLTYAKQALPLFEESPLFGVGPGRFGGEIANRFKSPIYSEHKILFNENWTTVDSFWVHLLTESGVAGVGLMLILFLLLFIRARRLAKRTEDEWVKTALVAAPMLLVGHLTINFTAMALEANTTAGLFWLIFGTVFSAAGDQLSPETEQ